MGQEFAQRVITAETTTATITVSGEGAAAKLRRVRDYRAFNTEVQQFADFLTDHLRRWTPRRSGDLASKWEPTYEIGPTGMVKGFRIQNTAGKPQLVRWLEFGTAPHTILPKNKSALAFPLLAKSYPKGAEKPTLTTTGQVVTRRVEHPGTRAYAFVALVKSIMKRNLAGLNQRLKQRLVQGRR